MKLHLPYVLVDLSELRFSLMGLGPSCNMFSFHLSFVAAMDPAELGKGRTQVYSSSGSEFLVVMPG